MTDTAVDPKFSVEDTDVKAKFTEALKAENAKQAVVTPQLPPDDGRYERDRDPSKNVQPDPRNIDAKLEQAPTKAIVAEAAKAVVAAKAELAKADSAVEDYPENAKSPEAKSSWDKLKADREEKAKRVAALEAELLAVKQQFDPEAYKKAKEENELLSLEIRKLGVERHPKFKEAFEKPIAEAVERAKKTIPAEYHKEVDKWLKQPDSAEKDAALQVIYEALPPHKVGVFVRYVEDANLAIEKRSEALKQEGEWVARFEADQKAAEERARTQADALARSTFTNVLKTKFHDNPLFAETDPHYQDRVKSAESLLFGNNQPEQLAEAALYAEYGRSVEPLLRQAHDEIARLTEQVNKLQAGGGIRTPSAGGSQNTGGESDWRTAVNAAFNRLSAGT